MVKMIRGVLSITNKAPDDTALLLAAQNTLRVSLIIRNVGTVDVYFGTDDSVTTDSGYPLKADEEMKVDYTYSAVYAITAGGTADIRVYEVTMK